MALKAVYEKKKDIPGENTMKIINEEPKQINNLDMEIK